VEHARLRQRHGRSVGRDLQIGARRRSRFPSFEHKHVEHETLHWIGFYNEERLHEELGDLPPAEYEEFEYQEPTTAEPWLPDKTASMKPRALHPSLAAGRHSSNEAVPRGPKRSIAGDTQVDRKARLWRKHASLVTHELHCKRDSGANPVLHATFEAEESVTRA
jgi:hypothetical protein